MNIRRNDRVTFTAEGRSCVGVITQVHARTGTVGVAEDPRPDTRGMVTHRDVLDADAVKLFDPHGVFNDGMHVGTEDNRWDAQDYVNNDDPSATMVVMRMTVRCRRCGDERVLDRDDLRAAAMRISGVTGQIVTDVEALSLIDTCPTCVRV